MSLTRTLKRRMKRNAGKQGKKSFKFGRNYKQEMKLEQLEPRLLLSGESADLIYENISEVSSYVEDFSSMQEEDNDALDTALPFMKMSKMIQSGEKTENEIVSPSIDDLLSYESGFLEGSGDYANPFGDADTDGDGRISLAGDISDYISNQLDTLSDPETIEDIVSGIDDFDDVFVYETDDGEYEHSNTALDDESYDLVFRSEWDAQDISGSDLNAINLSYTFETNHDTVLDFGKQSIIDAPEENTLAVAA